MPVFTIGVISDTHIPLDITELPANLLHEFATFDAIIHAGDFVTLEVLRILQALGPQVYAVYGNLDGYDLRCELPKQRIEELGGKRIGITHGWGPPIRLQERVRQRFESVDMVVFGHSHIPCVEEIGGIIMLNPGSIAMNRHHASPSYAVVHIEEGISIEHKYLLKK